MSSLISYFLIKATVNGEARQNMKKKSHLSSLPHQNSWHIKSDNIYVYIGLSLSFPKV